MCKRMNGHERVCEVKGCGKCFASWFAVVFIVVGFVTTHMTFARTFVCRIFVVFFSKGKHKVREGSEGWWMATRGCRRIRTPTLQRNEWVVSQLCYCWVLHAVFFLVFKSSSSSLTLCPAQIYLGIFYRSLSGYLILIGLLYDLDFSCSVEF